MIGKLLVYGALTLGALTYCSQQPSTIAMKLITPASKPDYHVMYKQENEKLVPYLVDQNHTRKLDPKHRELDQLLMNYHNKHAQ